MAVFVGFPNWSGSNPLTTCRGRGDEQWGAVLGGGKERWRKTWSVFGGKCSTSEESHSSEGSLGELLCWPLAMCWRRTHTEEPRTFILEKLCMTSKDPRENHIWFNIRKSRTSDLQWAAWVSVSAAISLCSGLTKPSEYTNSDTQTLLWTYFLYWPLSLAYPGFLTSEYPHLLIYLTWHISSKTPRHPSSGGRQV